MLGPRGQLTVRADSGFYTHAVVAVCRKTKVRFSITIRQRASLRNLIEAIPEADWTSIPYLDGRRRRCGRDHLCPPFKVSPTPHRCGLIVRRVKPTPGSQLALFASYSYHGFITDRDGDTLELEADHRRHAEIENAIRDLKYGVGLNHLPSGRFAANGRLAGGPGDGPQPGPLDGPHRPGVSRSSPPRPSGDGSSPWPVGSPARPAASLCISPGAGLGKPSSARALARLQTIPLPA